MAETSRPVPIKRHSEYRREPPNESRRDRDYGENGSNNRPNSRRSSLGSTYNPNDRDKLQVPRVNSSHDLSQDGILPALDSAPGNHHPSPQKPPPSRNPSISSNMGDQPDNTSKEVHHCGGHHRSAKTTGYSWEPRTNLHFYCITSPRFTRRTELDTRPSYRIIQAANREPNPRRFRWGLAGKNILQPRQSLRVQATRSSYRGGLREISCYRAPASQSR